MRVSVDFEPLPYTGWAGLAAEPADPAVPADFAFQPAADAETDSDANSDGEVIDPGDAQAALAKAQAFREAVVGLFVWLDERFGLDASAFAQHRFWHRPGHPSVWVADADCLPPSLPRAEAVGLLVARLKGRVIKPTSVFLQRFGHACTRNVYVLDDARLFRWLAQQPVPVAPVQDGSCDGDGFVVVKDHAGTTIGCGMLRGAVLTSELPRSWTYSD